ncbi:MAG: hypothetical protein NZ553_05125 [Caldilinea sp.]|nr:hypothetical protein [Caldilinea sp.]MDW8439839.1 hypothetical protein [Caldilineaceae bacterium]
MNYLHSLSSALEKIATGRLALLSTILFFVFLVVVLPAQADATAAVTGAAETPDTAFFYTAGELYRIADALGEAGRSHYIRSRFTFDVVWPLVYMTFLVTTIGWSTQRGFDASSPWRLLNLLPVAGALLDFLENSATSLVMARYPATTPVVAELAGLFTLLKWAFVFTSFAALVVALLAAGVRRFSS